MGPPGGLPRPAPEANGRYCNGDAPSVGRRGVHGTLRPGAKETLRDKLVCGTSLWALVLAGMLRALPVSTQSHLLRRLRPLCRLPAPGGAREDGGMVLTRRMLCRTFRRSHANTAQSTAVAVAAPASQCGAGPSAGRISVSMTTALPITKASGSDAPSQRASVTAIRPINTITTAKPSDMPTNAVSIRTSSASPQM